ncbi:hypothetical protein [Pendulispora albinea]|uniref:Lipoprotein n=1 Tax=Pendulispora albinea TaxID=2741071 RepID=A0ABZ2LUG2_9BACT
MMRALPLAAASMFAACSASSEPAAGPKPGDAGTRDTGIADAAAPEPSCDGATGDAGENRDAAKPSDPALRVCPSGKDYEALEEHSCLHRTYGPSRAVTAASAQAAPDVSEPHTEFVVTLPPTCGSHTGIVRYTARKSRPYMVYADIDPGLVVTARSGQTLAPVCAGSTLGKCAGLTYVTKLPLVQGETYELTLGASGSLGASGASRVALVIEEIEFEDP